MRGLPRPPPAAFVLWRSAWADYTLASVPQARCDPSAILRTLRGSRPSHKCFVRAVASSAPPSSRTAQLVPSVERCASPRRWAPELAAPNRVVNDARTASPTNRRRRVAAFSAGSPVDREDPPSIYGALGRGGFAEPAPSAWRDCPHGPSTLAASSPFAPDPVGSATA